MRRSKSNPAKYARNYKSISQRRMTETEDFDEEKEIARLRQVLESTQHVVVTTESGDEHASTEQSASRKRQRPPEMNDDERETSRYEGLLSKEVSESMLSSGDIPLILPSKKKKGPKQIHIELTPQEIRQAKALQKNVTRKLKQLETRADQKKKRKELYSKLEQTSITAENRELLLSSATLGKKASKKEQLKRLLQRQRAGLELTEEEHQLLYRDRDIPEPAPEQNCDQMKTSTNLPLSKLEKKKRKESDKSKSMDEAGTSSNKPNVCADTCNKESGLDLTGEELEHSASAKGQLNEETEETKSESAPLASSFAAQMLASLSNLKKSSQIQSELVASKEREDEEKRLEEEAAKVKSMPRYVPPTPTILKTAAGLGLTPLAMNSLRKVCEIPRPEHIKATRYDLPVSAMEFEVMDAIRNNDVTIICGETGSGKSTQIPQFIYEYGLTLNPEGDDHGFVVGVTQPRRVAAVSTAKRVCYEMGQGNGSIIPNHGGLGNLVSYQTRFEKSGLGSNNRVKFMTDGILLQEIQSDLLLRQYSVIVLDEAHERNLNTDVLIGLLSAALPLRKQAANEPGSCLVPLKLVIMSATLRVEDFTSNEKLFPTCAPAIVKIPGRTFPVTIHHSKVTELDDYENVAFQKICKIHRKLPPGGILVFLTGKHEILRMVRRLRASLSSEKNAARIAASSNDVSEMLDECLAEVPRDLDDDELDGDLFQDDDADDTINKGTVKNHKEDNTGDVEDNIPKEAIILPLYSLLNGDEQAKIFAPVPDGQRLIVVATNIAETSITIPGISYVVDTGRHKCRNYKSGTGVASYDIMWISKAAADQRAGRAGRTGPGHCYRLYSSSVYSRQFDSFALPEVLTRPLEDVVLAMKAMKISHVGNFPFPTPPDKTQLASALETLANIGCVDLSNIETGKTDGEVTKLGAAVAKLPMGVRYGKMLLVAAQGGVLDYAIAMVAALSELTPFILNPDDQDTTGDADADEEEFETEGAVAVETATKSEKMDKKWSHRGGDILAATIAVGAYAFAGYGAGGVAEAVACKKFCRENGLNYAIMLRIHKMRVQLARLAGFRLSAASGIAAKTGGIVCSMPPPNHLQEQILRQAIASGLLDNVAMLAPPGSVPGERSHNLRNAYISCSASTKEPLFMDRNSVVFSRDARLLPQMVCFDSLTRKTLKDGTPIAVMKKITPISASWLGELAVGSKLLRLGEPLSLPPPTFDRDQDAVLCSVSTKYGFHSWELPPVKIEMFNALQGPGAKSSGQFAPDESFRYFARFLLEGKVLPELEGLSAMLNDSPSVISRKVPVKKAGLLVSALSSAGVDSASALRKHWAEENDKFLFKYLKHWIKADCVADAQKLWIETVNRNIEQWRQRSTAN